MNYYTTGTAANSISTNFVGYVQFQYVRVEPPKPQLPPPDHPLMLALTLFGLTAPANWLDVEKAYKRLVRANRSNHPDLGGDGTKLLELNNAFALLKEQKPQ